MELVGVAIYTVCLYKSGMISGRSFLLTLFASIGSIMSFYGSL